MNRTYILDETKKFAATASDKRLTAALVKSSNSPKAAAMRMQTYQKVFSNFKDLKNIYTKLFSGYTESPLISSQYFNATVASYVNSFAGFLSIERAMDQPTGLLPFMDVLGVTDNRKVLPNLGPEDLSNIQATINTEINLVTGTTAYTLALGKKIVPGSVKIRLFDQSAGTYTDIIDNRAGSFLAPAGILALGTINYITGAIALTTGAGFTPATNDKFIVKAAEDVSGVPDTTGTPAGNYRNRFKTGFTNVEVATFPDMLIGESNLISLAAMEKSLGINAADFLAAKLTELYTKLINKQQIAEIQNAYTGNTTTIDFDNTVTNYHDYRSGIDRFSGGLISVEGALAQKSVKGVRATCWLVGATTADMFRKTKITGQWVDNVDATYINDLLGYYEGVPVLRHEDVADEAGYAVHKTADGNLAPVMRGIFLPLTNTPSIGNYQNPTQVSQGVFYQEGNKSVAPELVQKFVLTNLV